MGIFDNRVVIVNHAARAGLWRGMDEDGLLNCPDDVWQRGWDVDVTGTLRCSQVAMAYLCGEHAGYATGQTVYVDGGGVTR